MGLKEPTLGGLRLAIVPGNSMDDLIEQGIGSRLYRYHNPAAFFEKVFCLSPFETRERDVEGIHVIPTRDTELPSRIRALKIDLVRAYGARTPAEIVAFYRAQGVPVIVSVHDKRPEMFSPALKFADAVFVVSEELRVIVEARGVRSDRIFVVLNGVDEDLMRPLPASELAGFDVRFPFLHRLLHVGRKSPEKNIETIIRALPVLGPTYGLVSLGQGNVSGYCALADSLGVGAQCVFLPGVEQEELVRFYNWAECVCHPSLSEAMCNVLVEALACGAAVVASRTAAAGLGERPAQAMRLIEDPMDVMALAREIRRVCEDDGLRREQKAQARASVSSLFLKRTQAHEVACYRAVLEMHAAGVFRRGWRDDLVLSVANIWRRAVRRSRCRG